MGLIVEPLFDLEDQFRKFPQSKFAAERKFDIHTGVDIYTEPYKVVRSLFSGEIVDLGIFTGEEVGSPWWNTTSYVVIKHDVGYILYGELIVDGRIKVGDQISKYGELGITTPVLKLDKGVNPTTMLHLELYFQYEEPVQWNLGEDMPYGLLDPTPPLREAGILNSINDCSKDVNDH